MFIYVVFNHLAPLGIFPLRPQFPKQFLRAIFEWAILKIEAKITLLKFLGNIFLNYGPILKIKKQGYS